MSTVMELMFAVRERAPLYYHKETNQFDNWPVTAKELEKLDPNKKISLLKHDANNIMFLTYEQIDHREKMRFFVRECVEDKEIRKQLFGILSRRDYIDDFLKKLRELELYDEFEGCCWDIYDQMFKEWAEENGLDFSKGS